MWDSNASIFQFLVDDSEEEVGLIDAWLAVVFWEIEAGRNG